MLFTVFICIYVYVIYFYYINNKFYRYHIKNWINFGLVGVQVIVADTKLLHAMLLHSSIR